MFDCVPVHSQPPCDNSRRVPSATKRSERRGSVYCRKARQKLSAAATFWPVESAEECSTLYRHRRQAAKSFLTKGFRSRHLTPHRLADRLRN
jgi:hypothetical protein